MTSTQTKKLRIGLLGFGAMGKTHLYAIRNLPLFYGALPFEAVVGGVCTTSMEKSQSVAKTFDIPFATDDPDALISNPDIDVIDICTPNVHHYEALKKAISAGLFWQMLGAMKRTGSRDAYENWNTDIPILLMSGKDDPVGGFGEGVRKLREQMKKAEFTHLTMYLMPEARHDVLHEEECGAASVRTIIADWIAHHRA